MLCRSWRGISCWITTLGAESARSRQTRPDPAYGAGGRDITTTQPTGEPAMLAGQWHSAGRGQTATQSRRCSGIPWDKLACFFQPRDPPLPLPTQWLIHSRAPPRAGAPGGTSHFCSTGLERKAQERQWERNHGILKWFGGWVGKDPKDQPVPTRKSQQLPTALGGRRVVMQSPLHYLSIPGPISSQKPHFSPILQLQPPRSRQGQDKGWQTGCASLLSYW